MAIKKPSVKNVLSDLLSSLPSNMPCDYFHHRKNEYHKFDEPCKAKDRFDSARLTATSLLSDMKKRGKS